MKKGVVRQNDGQLPNYGLHKKITATSLVDCRRLFFCVLFFLFVCIYIFTEIIKQL